MHEKFQRLTVSFAVRAAIFVAAQQKWTKFWWNQALTRPKYQLAIKLEKKPAASQNNHKKIASNQAEVKGRRNKMEINSPKFMVNPADSVSMKDSGHSATPAFGLLLGGIIGIALWIPIIALVWRAL